MSAWLRWALQPHRKSCPGNYALFYWSVKMRLCILDKDVCICVETSFSDMSQVISSFVYLSLFWAVLSVSLALPNAKEDVARTKSERQHFKSWRMWTKPVVTDKQRRSPRKQMNERAFWKVGKGGVWLCMIFTSLLHSIHFHFFCGKVL